MMDFGAPVELVIPLRAAGRGQAGGVAVLSELAAA